MINNFIRKIIGENILLRRIIRREYKNGNSFKAAALLMYLLPVNKSLSLDEFLKSYLRIAQKEYYTDIQKLLHIAKVNGFSFTRIGSKNDGGYVMLDDFSGGLVYSFGIGGDVSWDKDMASRGYDVFMYDHTIEKLPEENSRFHFFKQGISDGKTRDERLKTLDELIKQNHHEDKRDMILKIDVEGAEWGFLENVSSETLSQFKQIVFELHGIINPKNTPENVMNSFKKINATHQLIHLHPCNFEKYISINGKIFPNVLEACYVLRDKYSFVEDYDVKLPLSLDNPNNENLPEIELGRWNNFVEIDGDIPFLF